MQTRTVYKSQLDKIEAEINYLRKENKQLKDILSNNQQLKEERKYIQKTIILQEEQKDKLQKAVAHLQQQEADYLKELKQLSVQKQELMDQIKELKQEANKKGVISQMVELNAKLQDDLLYLSEELDLEFESSVEVQQFITKHKKLKSGLKGTSKIKQGNIPADLSRYIRRRSDYTNVLEAW